MRWTIFFRIALLLSSLCYCLAAEAQPELVLTKRTKVIYRFHEGDRIRFQKKGDDYFTSGVISGIHRDFIMIDNVDTTYWYQIHGVDMSGKGAGFVTPGKGRVLMGAGLVLVLADVLNPNQSKELDSGVLTVACSMFGVGLLMQFVNNDYFKVGRKKKVAILH